MLSSVRYLKKITPPYPAAKEKGNKKWEIWNRGPTTIWHNIESVNNFFLSQNHSTLPQVAKLTDFFELNP